PIAVDEVIDGRCDAWDAFAAEKHVRIAADVAGSPAARATPGRLEQVVDNLLNNALEVAPEGSAVHVAAREQGEWGELRVSAEGPGMSAEGRACAFDRFWQSGEARRDGRPNGHFGLGLSIVRELVVGDGGDVALEPSPAGGLEVVVRMRRSDAPLPTRERQLSTVATRSSPSARTRAAGRPLRVRSTRSCRVTRSRISRVSSETPTHTSCSTQWPSQWSCSPISVVSGPSTAARMSASVISAGGRAST